MHGLACTVCSQARRAKNGRVPYRSVVQTKRRGLWEGPIDVSGLVSLFFALLAQGSFYCGDGGVRNPNRQFHWLGDGREK